MTRSIFKHPGTRFAPVLQLSCIALIAFAGMRGVLLMRAWPYIDHFSSAWPYIFGFGMIYDLAFISYFYIPVVLFFLSIPNKWMGSRIVRYLIQAGTYYQGADYVFTHRINRWGDTRLRDHLARNSQTSPKSQDMALF